METKLNAETILVLPNFTMQSIRHKQVSENEALDEVKKDGFFFIESYWKNFKNTSNST